MTAQAPVPTVTSPVPRQAWESVVKSDPGALVTQSLPWRDALFASGRYRDVSRLYEFGSGQRIVLPLAQRKHLPTRVAAVSSWPQPWAVGGPISSDGRVTSAEAAAVLTHLASSGAVATEVKLRHDADPNWLSAADSRFQVTQLTDWILDLDGGFDQVWSRKFPKSLRRSIHKAERSGLDIEVDRSGKQLDIFYQLYQKSVIRWAAMQHAPVWLTRARLGSDVSQSRAGLLTEAFGPQLAFWLASVGGQPAAALVVLHSGSYAKYLWGAMNKQLAAPTRAADLLHRLAIEEACQLGFRYYDLGGARPESPIGAYKRKFGASLVHRHTLRLERLPIHAAAQLPRTIVKRAIGFRDNV
jgi:CelD/BcsL family acetyltransferase involved in cellulose biosynthesis